MTAYVCSRGTRNVFYIWSVFILSVFSVSEFAYQFTDFMTYNLREREKITFAHVRNKHVYLRIESDTFYPQFDVNGFRTSNATSTGCSENHNILRCGGSSRRSRKRGMSGTMTNPRKIFLVPSKPVWDCPHTRKKSNIQNFN